MWAAKEPGIDQDLLTLSRSPEFKVKTYKSYDIQGFKFRTKSSEESNCTQNSGVVVLATTTSYTGVHDNSPRERDLTYYGVIKDIIELSFDDGCRKIVLFECDWADNNKNRTDKYGFTLVDLTSFQDEYTSNTTILCSTSRLTSPLT